MMKTTLQLSEAILLGSSLKRSTATQATGYASGMTLLADGVVPTGDEESAHVFLFENLGFREFLSHRQMEESRRLAGETSREIEKILRLRREYSGRCVEVHFGKQPSGRCLQTSLHRLSYRLCRSEALGARDWYLFMPARNPGRPRTARAGATP